MLKIGCLWTWIFEFAKKIIIGALRLKVFIMEHLESALGAELKQMWESRPRRKLNDTKKVRQFNEFNWNQSGGKFTLNVLKKALIELFKLSVKDVENITYLVYLFTPFYPKLFSILPAITFSTYTQIIERSQFCSTSNDDLWDGCELLQCLNTSLALAEIFKANAAQVTSFYAIRTVIFILILSASSPWMDGAGGSSWTQGTLIIWET